MREIFPLTPKGLVEYLDLLDEDEYYDLRVKAREEGDDEFRAEIGAEAIRSLRMAIKFADVDRPQKIGRIRNWLYHRRFPRLAGAEDVFRRRGCLFACLFVGHPARLVARCLRCRQKRFVRLGRRQAQG